MRHSSRDSLRPISSSSANRIGASLPLPAIDQVYWEVSAIDAGQVHMLLSQLVDIAKEGEMVDLPVLSFVLRHSRTDEVVLFDLGIRPDTEAYTGARALADTMDITFQGRDIPAALERGGVSRADVKHVVISHIHFDHTGYPRAFPNAQFIIGGAARKVIEEEGPDYPDTFYAINVPLERALFLSPEDPVGREWGPLGPFPHALDFFDDGSLYVIDAPGHVPGHICVMARTSSDGAWVCLAGDGAHDWRHLTGEAGIGHNLVCMHLDLPSALENIARLKAVKDIPKVRLLLTHDVPFVKEGKGYWPETIAFLKFTDYSLHLLHDSPPLNRRTRLDRGAPPSPHRSLTYSGPNDRNTGIYPLSDTLGRSADDSSSLGQPIGHIRPPEPLNTTP
ncbi:beta-lactamase-like protein [Cerioporus squamosus]|nr:beta-lactamase-like protein [Cerioporus squamosus]